MTRFQFLRAVLLIGVLATLDAASSKAQWVQTNGPSGGSVSSFVAVPNGAGGTRLYAGQIRIWSTDDGGGSWTHLTNGLTHPSAFSLIAVPDGSGGNDILVGSNGGVFRSTDDGGSWHAINNGLTNLTVYALASGSNGSGGINLYAGTFDGHLFRSTNNGESWTPIEIGVPFGYNVNELVTTATGTVLAATMNGIYRSTNFGGSWTQVFSSFYGFSFTQSGSTLYAGTSNGPYRSTNDGLTWTPINNGLQLSWIQSMAAIPSQSGVTLFAGAGRVLRSTDNGATWVLADNGMPAAFINALATMPNGSGGTDLYAGTTEGVFRTSNNGGSWTNVSFVFSEVQGLGVTPSGAILAGERQRDIFRSSDGGDSWTDTDSQSGGLDFAINPQGTNGVSLFGVDPLNGVRKSTDDGVTWFDSNNDIADIEVNSVTVMSNDAGGMHVIAGTYFGICISTNDGGSWQLVEPLLMPLDYVVTPNGSGGHDIFGGGFNGVGKSTNYGQTWTFLPGIGQVVQSMATTGNGANLFAGGDPFGVFRSTDHGQTWTLVNNGLDDLRIFALLSPDGTHLFAGGLGGVYLSSNNGNTWSTVSTGLTTGVLELALSDDGLTLLAGTASYGVWKRPLAEMITTAGVDEAANAPANAVLLHANLPNPFRGETTIHYALPQAMQTRLVIYDVAGHAVRTLVNGSQGAGVRQVIWDGRNDGGAAVSRGVYLYRLEAGGTTLTRKMIRH
jgi:hypothetical protein